MKLYHGTSIDRLESILKNGLAPRENGESNWTKYPSVPGHVYLTTAYPFYFACMAKTDSDDTRAVVLEIDSQRLDPERIYPDEDFISQALQDMKNHQSYAERIEEYRDSWKHSIEHLGNCSYRGTIPASAIRRYCVFDYKKRAPLAMTMMDPAITLINFKLKGWFYRQFIAWMFGDTPDIPHYAEAKQFLKLGAIPEVKEQMEYWKAQSKNREGIEVVKIRRGKNKCCN